MDVNLRSIEVTDHPEESRFEALLGDQMAVLVYQLSEEWLVLEHTEVPSDAREQGVGSKLVKEALDTASSRGLQVVPRCPFVRRYIQQHPEYESLIAQ